MLTADDTSLDASVPRLYALKNLFARLPAATPTSLEPPYFCIADFITVETVEKLFDKKMEGFGELYRQESYKEIGLSSILSRATAGVYKKTLIFSLPGSPNAVKTGLKIIIDELPHIVFHAKG